MPAVPQLRVVTGTDSSWKGVSGGQSTRADEATAATWAASRRCGSCWLAGFSSSSRSSWPPCMGIRCVGRPSPSTPLAEAATASSITRSEMARTSACIMRPVSAGLPVRDCSLAPCRQQEDQVEIRRTGCPGEDFHIAAALLEDRQGLHRLAACQCRSARTIAAAGQQASADLIKEGEEEAKDGLSLLLQAGNQHVCDALHRARLRAHSET